VGMSHASDSALTPQLWSSHLLLPSPSLDPSSAPSPRIQLWDPLEHPSLGAPPWAMEAPPWATGACMAMVDPMVLATAALTPTGTTGTAVAAAGPAKPSRNIPLMEENHQWVPNRRSPCCSDSRLLSCFSSAPSNLSSQFYFQFLL